MLEAGETYRVKLRGTVIDEEAVGCRSGGEAKDPENGFNMCGRETIAMESRPEVSPARGWSTTTPWFVQATQDGDQLNNSNDTVIYWCARKQCKTF